MHAHVDPSVSARDLLELRAVVFAANRTLRESADALDRQHSDVLAVWGVGVHPGVKAALDTFDSRQFANLVARSAYVGEIGLDGQAKSRLPRQIEVLTSMLDTLQTSPRITSLHSYDATADLIEVLEQSPIPGAILHWWLGDLRLTSRAIEIGAYFSVNASSLKNIEILMSVPLDRILTETDHPDGNRRSSRPHQPGNVSEVEKSLGRRHGLSPSQFRAQCWRNLRELTTTAGCEKLLPGKVQALLAEA